MWLRCVDAQRRPAAPSGAQRGLVLGVAAVALIRPVKPVHGAEPYWSETVSESWEEEGDGEGRRIWTVLLLLLVSLFWFTGLVRGHAFNGAAAQCCPLWPHSRVTLSISLVALAAVWATPPPLHLPVCGGVM